MTLGAHIRPEDGAVVIHGNSGAPGFKSTTVKSFTEIEIVEDLGHLRSFWSSLGQCLDTAEGGGGTA